MKHFFFFIFIILFSTSCSSRPDEYKELFTGHWLERAEKNRHFSQGISLNPDGTASSIGMATLKYDKWAIKDKHLILWGKSIGNRQTIDFSEEWLVVEINANLMKLKNAKGYQITYDRTENNPNLQQWQE